MLVALLCGCGAADRAPAPSAQPDAPPVERTCASQLTDNEIQGRGPAGVQLWGLLFSPYPLPSADEVKIVWRMTGSGDLTLTASGPQDEQITPVWGPEAHASSTWDRPGSEWGSGFVFPSSGCWTIRARRGGDTATATLEVAG